MGVKIKKARRRSGPFYFEVRDRLVLRFRHGRGARGRLVAGDLADSAVIAVLAVARSRGLLATAAGTIQGHALGAAIKRYGAAAIMAGDADMGIEHHHI